MDATDAAVGKIQRKLAEHRRRQFVSFINKIANEEARKRDQCVIKFLLMRYAISTCAIHLGFTWRVVKCMFYGECADTFSHITEADIRSATETEGDERDLIRKCFTHVETCIATWETVNAHMTNTERSPAHTHPIAAAQHTHASKPLWINFYFAVIMFCSV